MNTKSNDMSSTFKILEKQITLNADVSIASVILLVEFSKGDSRVILADQKIRHGYMSIPKDVNQLSVDLIQQIAGYGMEITDNSTVPIEWIKKYNLLK